MGTCALSRLVELCYLLMRKHHYHHDLVTLSLGKCYMISIMYKPQDRSS